jgi:hypothetical protein
LKTPITAYMEGGVERISQSLTGSADMESQLCVFISDPKMQNDVKSIQQQPYGTFLQSLSDSITQYNASQSQQQQQPQLDAEGESCPICGLRRARKQRPKRSPRQSPISSTNSQSGSRAPRPSGNERRDGTGEQQLLYIMDFARILTFLNRQAIFFETPTVRFIGRKQRSTEASFVYSTQWSSDLKADSDRDDQQMTT